MDKHYKCYTLFRLILALMQLGGKKILVKLVLNLKKKKYL